MGFLILRIVGILCLRFRYIFISIHILTHLLTLTGIKMEKAEEWFNYGIELAKEFGPKLITAILIYIVGSWIIKKIAGAARKMMAKSKYDESLQRFF